MAVQPGERELLVVRDGPVTDALEALPSVLGWQTVVAATCPTG